MIEGPYRTKDYNIFKFDSMNREIDERHVKRLVTSFEKKYVEKPIIVNQNIVIMDGQHTFLALKQLGLEISYNIHHGMTIDDVPVLNGNQKAWTFHHYLDFYAKKEKKENPTDYALLPYNLYKSFYKSHPYPAFILLDLLSGVGFGAHPLKIFKEGNIQVKDFNDAKRKIKMIEEMKPFTMLYKSRSFNIAFINALEHYQFNFKRWMDQLEKNRSELYSCNTAAQYMERNQYIYNYRKGDKLIFSFKQKANGSFVKLAS